MTKLVDTNVLVYAAGIRADARRQRAAVQLLDDIRPHACLSLQVLSEFAAVSLKNGMDAVTCRAIVAEFCRSWTILVPTPVTLDAAIAAVSEYRMSFWDAMLWAVAREHGLTEIITEDGPTNAVVEGVGYRNPFQDLKGLAT
jgi:predicted nucleic acid-binding protein